MKPNFDNMYIAFHGFFVEHLPLFRSNVLEKMRQKTDGTKVGRADLELHAALTHFVTRLFPLPVVSEEMEHEWPPPCASFWIIDPFDGSNNDAMGLPLVGSMATRVESGVPTFTCIFLPTDRSARNPSESGFYFAGRGQGAWCFRHHRSRGLHVGGEATLTNANLLLEGSSKKLIEDERIRRVIRATARFRNDLTPAWALTRLAMGRVEVVVALDNKPTDNIHGILFTEEAGGKVTDFDGNPPTLTNCRNLVYSNGLVHDLALRALKGE